MAFVVEHIHSLYCSKKRQHNVDFQKYFIDIQIIIIYY